YIIYRHRWLFVIGMLVMTIGHIMCGLQFSTFKIFMIAILLIGFTNYSYHEKDSLFGYLVVISYEIQMITFTITYEQQYYCLLIYFLLLYIIGQMIDNHVLGKILERVGIISLFLLGMYQVFVLQNNFFFEQEYSFSLPFLLIWIVMIGWIVSIHL